MTKRACLTVEVQHQLQLLDDNASLMKTALMIPMSLLWRVVTNLVTWREMSVMMLVILMKICTFTPYLAIQATLTALS